MTVVLLTKTSVNSGELELEQPTRASTANVQTLAVLIDQLFIPMRPLRATKASFRYLGRIKL
jgi:hypothetical protein